MELAGIGRMQGRRSLIPDLPCSYVLHETLPS